MVFTVFLLCIASLGILYLLIKCLNKLYDIEDLILNLKERGGFDVFDITN